MNQKLAKEDQEEFIERAKKAKNQNDFSSLIDELKNL